MNIEWTPIYIVAQIVTIVFYAIFAYSYFLKKRRAILVAGIIGLILNAAAFVLLGAWSGLATCSIALIGNLIPYFKKTKKFGESTWFFMLILCALTVAAIFTFNGFLSLMSVFATVCYRYSVWQKSPRVYKICGIPVGILWVIYNVFIASVFGVILESALLVFVIIGLILDIKNGKLDKKSH
jgi:hypothetical protein